MTTEERESKLNPSEPFQELSETERAPIEARNAIEQFDLLKSMIEQGLDPARRFKLRVSALNRLNEQAVKGLVRSPGALRTEDITIIGSQHTPPNWQELQQLMEEMCD